MKDDSTVYVGLDVHKESITVAYAIDAGEVESVGKIGTTQTEIDRLCKRLQSKASHVRVVYEAGPCGYGLYRQLAQRGFESMVCAPSLIPRKPGERVKTDRRDAAKLVRSLRAGDLSAVYVPGVEDEAFRDLARAWAAVKEDLRQARQRLKSFLLAHGVGYTGRANWSEAHRRWLCEYSFANAWQQLAFEEHRRTIEDRLVQCGRLEAALRDAVVHWRFYPGAGSAGDARSAVCYGCRHGFRTGRSVALHASTSAHGVAWCDALGAFVGQQATSGQHHQDW